MAYVYSHTRLDTNEVFYIGIGSDDKYKRSNSNNCRNKHWYNIVKHTLYKVKIIINNISWNEACIQEIILIKFYGRKDLGLGSLCNMTNGGEGNLGGIYTESVKLKMSLLAKKRFKKEIHCRKGKTFINKNSRKVVIVDLKHYIISNFDSIVQASLFIKKSSSQVRRACISSEKYINRSINGYFIKFGEYILEEEIEYLKLNKHKLIDIQDQIPKKKCSDITKLKMSISAKEKFLKNPEFIENLKILNSGVKHPQYGIPRSLSTKSKISKSNKGIGKPRSKSI